MDNRTGIKDFKVQRMEIIYEQTHGKTDVAHRHDYFTVLLIEKAKGFHIIEYNEFSFEDNEISIA